MRIRRERVPETTIEAFADAHDGSDARRPTLGRRERLKFFDRSERKSVEFSRKNSHSSG